jgi:hypothetical protein
MDGVAGYGVHKTISSIKDPKVPGSKPVPAESEAADMYRPQKRKMGYDSAKRRQLNDGTILKASENPGANVINILRPL